MNKKGIVEFVFSKLAFLVFGIIITAAFFYFLGVQKEIQGFNEDLKSAEGLVNLAGTVYAAPFNTTVTYNSGFKSNVSVWNNSIILGSIKYPYYFKINDSFEFSGDCISLKKLNTEMVIYRCP